MSSETNESQMYQEIFCEHQHWEFRVGIAAEERYLRFHFLKQVSERAKAISVSIITVALKKPDMLRQ